MSALVLGSSGQVATHLREFLPSAVFWGRKSFDLTASLDLAAAIIALHPDVIINAAAYTAVDKAETDRTAAWTLNAQVPAAAAAAATTLGIPLVHFSTDYVFDGRKAKPYAVDDGAAPLSVYGATKLAGEIAVRTLSRKHWIFRTSWVFSEHGANFVKTMLRLARGNAPVRVVADQHGRPTDAHDLALLAARVSEAPESLPYGTYHAVGGPATTWHAFAEAIMTGALTRGILQQPVAVTPITAAEYPTPAQRPANSLIEPSHEIRGLGVDLNWERGLERVLSRL